MLRKRYSCHSYSILVPIVTKTKVLLVHGGKSSEHDVSLMSARNVFAALDDSRYDVTLCLIDREGRWWLQDTIDDTHIGKPQLLPVFGQKKFITLPDHHIVQPDVIFPVLHGKNGEDGTVQGAFELLGIPYVGPSLLGAAVTMDKDMTKRLMEREGIPVVPWHTWRVHDRQPLYEQIKAELGEKVFVKPASAGSSIGVSRVNSAQDWEKILDVAAEHSDQVLIEKMIDAREIELAVLGNDEPKVSGAGEIVLGEQFYTYDEKYSSGSSATVIIPADITDDVLQQMQQYALTAYATCECRGMARVDFFIEKSTGNVYLNEVNSIPGFTNISMYPKLWRQVGVSYPHLVSTLIDLALE